MNEQINEWGDSIVAKRSELGHEEFPELREKIEKCLSEIEGLETSYEIAKDQHNMSIAIFSKCYSVDVDANREKWQIVKEGSQYLKSLMEQICEKRTVLAELENEIDQSFFGKKLTEINPNSANNGVRDRETGIKPST